MAEETSQGRWRRTAAVILGAVCCTIILLTGCVSGPPGRLPSSPVPVPTGSATPIDRWSEILQWTPYPYTTPLPARTPTAIDGAYVRFDPRTGARTPCRRCPPYPPEGGIWKLDLREGIFRVYHPRTGWRTLGSYTVNGSRVTFFNDPQCHTAIGVFSWSLEKGALHMQLVADDCELGTRAENFTSQPWESCQPPNTEAAVTGHWHPPEGCE